MRKSISARSISVKLAVLAAAFALIGASAGAWAQAAGDLRKDEAGNGYSPNLKSLGAVTAKVATTSKNCPKISVDAVLSRPISSSSEVFDELSVFELRNELRAAVSNPLAFNDPSECQALAEQKDPAEFKRTFNAHSPSPGILSVAFTVFQSSPWAAHPSTAFEAVNFSLAENRKLTLNDVFPPDANDGQVLEAVWAEAAKGWCAYNDNHTLPFFYQIDDDDLCKAPEKAPLPPALAADRGSFEALGNAYLTSEGMVLALSADDGWSYAQGPSELKISKETLIKLGAKASVWQAAK
jgi:hypothetical protein